MGIRLHPRFSVIQGHRCGACICGRGDVPCICQCGRVDGTIKVRPVDHFSWSAAGRSAKKRKLGSVNGQTEVLEALSHNHLDDLVEAMARLRRQVAFRLFCM